MLSILQLAIFFYETGSCQTVKLDQGFDSWLCLYSKTLWQLSNNICQVYKHIMYVHDIQQLIFVNCIEKQLFETYWF